MSIHIPKVQSSFWYFFPKMAIPYLLQVQSSTRIICWMRGIWPTPRQRLPQLNGIMHTISYWLDLQSIRKQSRPKLKKKSSNLLIFLSFKYMIWIFLRSKALNFIILVTKVIEHRCLNSKILQRVQSISAVTHWPYQTDMIPMQKVFLICKMLMQIQGWSRCD